MNYKLEAVVQIVFAMALIYAGQQMLTQGKQKLLG